MLIKRQLQEELASRFFLNKAIILLGPRQAGKTTLVKEILKTKNYAVEMLDGDDPTIRNMLDNPNKEQIRQIIGKSSVIFIDEAQRIPNIGITSKIIIDQFPDTQLILSGSSAFDLNQNIQEPLTGRKWSYNLYPISWKEWEDHLGYVKSEQDLENRLVFGLYPDVLNHREAPQRVLSELVDSYLYKDILSYAGIRKPDVIQKLVQAIAYQIGNEVVYNELAKTIGLDPKTVSNYIDILEKAFVLFRLPSFSKNIRNEIKNSRKIYFYDNGVRNAIIRAFDPVSVRSDVGMLWENFLVSERIKQISYFNKTVESYFWRTKQQQEIDYVEASSSGITGYEFKWNPQKRVKFPKTFAENYEAETRKINRDNFREFVSGF